MPQIFSLNSSCISEACITRLAFSHKILRKNQKLELNLMSHLTQSTSFWRRSSQPIKSKQHKIQHNKTTLVQLPLTTLGQERDGLIPQHPHGAVKNQKCYSNIRLRRQNTENRLHRGWIPHSHSCRRLSLHMFLTTKLKHWRSFHLRYDSLASPKGSSWTQPRPDEGEVQSIPTHTNMITIMNTVKHYILAVS